MQMPEPLPAITARHVPSSADPMKQGDYVLVPKRDLIRRYESVPGSPSGFWARVVWVMTGRKPLAAGSSISPWLRSRRRLAVPGHSPSRAAEPSKTRERRWLCGPLCFPTSLLFFETHDGLMHLTFDGQSCRRPGKLLVRSVRRLPNVERDIYRYIYVEMRIIPSLYGPL
jgi:hypothetical protein